MRFLHAVITATLLASVINAAPIASPLPAGGQTSRSLVPRAGFKFGAPKPVTIKTAAPKPVTTTTVAPKPVTTTTAAPKPVTTTTAAPKPVTTTTVAPKPVTTTTAAPKPATTKASAETKTPAKATSVTSAKAKTTTPAKTTPAKCPAKGKGKGVATGTAKAKAAVRSLVNAYNTLFRRAPEFVGYHGTNDKTAKLWTEAGKLVRPVSDSGAPEGTSGADAELGPGLYVADTLSTAAAFAGANAATNKLTPKVCAIFAVNSAVWRSRTAFPKFFFQDVRFPNGFVGNGKQPEVARQSLIECSGGNRNSIRMGPLPGVGGNQMVLPEALNSRFFAECFDVNGLDLVIPAGKTQPPDIRYTQLLGPWQITSNFDANVVKAALAAGKAQK